MTDQPQLLGRVVEQAAVGLTDVNVRNLGWRFWYDGSWGRTSAITATATAALGASTGAQG